MLISTRPHLRIPQTICSSSSDHMSVSITLCAHFHVHQTMCSCSPDRLSMSIIPHVRVQQTMMLMSNHTTCSCPPTTCPCSTDHMFITIRPHVYVRSDHMSMSTRQVQQWVHIHQTCLQNVLLKENSRALASLTSHHHIFIVMYNVSSYRQQPVIFRTTNIIDR